MTVYLDASVFYSLFLQDAHSARAAALVASAEDVAYSLWTLAEFSSAIGLQVRRGDLATVDWEAAERAVDTWSAARPAPVQLVSEDFVQARALLRRPETVLRAPDALHLGVVLRTGFRLATFDSAMVRAARILGVRLAEP